VNAACENNPGSFTCTCNEGFPGDGFSCFPTQTVYLTLTSTCALSDLTEESVVAEINANFAGAASVQSFDGFDNEFVVVTLVSASEFTADVISLFDGSAPGTCYTSPQTVPPLNPCGENPCGANTVCTNLGVLVQSAECACASGYDGSPPLEACEFIPLCSSSPCDSRATCSDVSMEQFTCTCEEGLVGDGFTCSSAFELQLTLNDGIEFTEELLNTSSVAFIELRDLVLAQLAAKYPGLDVTFVVVSFQQGSVIVNTLVLSDPDSVVDAAELIDTFDDAQGEPEFFNSQVVVGDPCMTASCPAESVCSQASPTEHTCVCNAGYAGSDCEDVDECDATPCAHTCSNFAGGFSCSCRDGFELSGATECVDVDECAAGTSDCLSGQDCFNMEGGFTCQCPPGTTIQEDDTCIDQCSVDYCLNGATCSPTNLVGNPVCTCTLMYDGPRCEDFSRLRTILIIVGVIGGVLLIALICVTVCLIKKRRQRKMNLA